MRTIEFSLYLTSEQWLDFYRGTIKHVVARSFDGRTVRFAAKHLQPYVTRDGVSGTFRIVFDEQNNFVRLEKMEGWRV
ncbi:MAG: DUF2835 domain-containing protein [Planctomycetota bacterium]